MEIQIISAAEIEHNLKMKAAALNYQKILDDINAIVFTPDNVNNNLLAPCDRLIKDFKAKKEELKRPYLEITTNIDTKFRELYQPLQDAFNRKSKELGAVIEKKKEEEAKIEQEKA